MNRRRKETHHQKISSLVIFSLILAMTIGAIGGVTFVVYRNSQIKTAREIDAIEQRIEQHQLDMRIVQMRADQILNLFAIRKTLEEVGTNLIPIPLGVSEDVIPPDDAPEPVSASASL
jgi:hypothetical protein